MHYFIFLEDRFTVFFFPDLLLHLMPILSSSHYFLFFLLLNGKGSNILSGHSYEALGSCHKNGFFCLEWTISINSHSGKVEPFFYFSYFCLRPACGPEKLAVADENLTWWYGVINFTRMLYEVVRPESLLAEGKKASSLGAAGSAWLCCTFIHKPTYPGKSCATLATSLSFSRALR